MKLLFVALFAVLCVVVVEGSSHNHKRSELTGSAYSDLEVYNMFKAYMDKPASGNSGFFGLSDKKMHEIIHNLPLYQTLKATYDP